MNPPRIAFLSALALACLAASSTVRAQTAPPPSETANAAAGDQPTGSPVVMNPFAVNTSTDEGYGAYATATTGRIVQNYVDVPQTVNVVTSQLIQDFNLENARNALMYEPNLYILNPESASFMVRGVSVTTIFVDGILQPSIYIGQPMDFYDRVELVKGPSPAAFGLGQPGGIINFVSKTPQGVDATSISIGYGLWNDKFVHLDTQGVSVKNPKLSYRVVAFYEGGNEAMPNQPHKDYGAQLSLHYAHDNTTSADLIVRDSLTDDTENQDYSEQFKSAIGYEIYQVAQQASTSFHYLPGTVFANGSIYGVSGTLPLPGAIGIPGTGELLGADANPTPGGFNGFYRPDFMATLLLDKSLADGHIRIHNAVSIDACTDLNEFASDGPLYSVPGSANTLPAGLVNGGEPTGLFNSAPLVANVGPTQVYTAETVDQYQQAFENRTEDLDVSAEYELGGFKSQTLLGGDYYDEYVNSSLLGIPNVNADGSSALYNLYSDNPRPVYVSPPNKWTISSLDSESHTYGAGFYAQENLSAFHDMLTLSAGWRIDYFGTYTQNPLATPVNAYTGWENTKGAPRYAITFKPFKWLSFYELYTVHKDPVSFTYKYFQTGEITPTIQALYPNLDNPTAQSYLPGGTTIESGMKASFLDGKLYASIAVFHEITEGNIVKLFNTYNDPDGTTTQVQIYQVEGFNNHGIELEVFGQPTPRLNMTADYGTTHGYGPQFILGTSASGASITSPDFVDPPPSLTFHAKYDFGDLRGNGFYATLGSLWFGPYWATEGTLPGQYIYETHYQNMWDGGFGYRWRTGRLRHSINVNMDNIFDSVVVNTTSGNSSIMPLRTGYISYKLSY